MGTWLDLGGALFTLLCAIVVIWAIARAWLRPRPAERLDQARVEAPPLDLPPAVRWSLDLIKRPFMVYEAPEHMSSDRAQPESITAGVDQVRHQAGALVSVSAEPNTDDTELVSGASGASDIDTDPRAIVRASLIAELLDQGIITNRDRAICVAFHCSKASSTRPDSTFQKALRLVEQHRRAQRPELVGEMAERVRREVAAEHK